jgi:hypothetical protein
MLTGEDVHDLIAAMRPGPKTGTRGREIVRVLRLYGVRCGERFESLRGKPFPRVAIVRIVHPNKRGHVVVKHDRTWFDPLLESPFTGDPPRGSVTPWAGESRITSALRIDLVASNATTILRGDG